MTIYRFKCDNRSSLRSLFFFLLHRVISLVVYELIIILPLLFKCLCVSVSSLIKRVFSAVIFGIVGRNKKKFDPSKKEHNGRVYEMNSINYCVTMHSVCLCSNILVISFYVSLLKWRKWCSDCRVVLLSPSLLFIQWRFKSGDDRTTEGKRNDFGTTELKHTMRVIQWNLVIIMQKQCLKQTVLLFKYSAFEFCFISQQGIFIEYMEFSKAF